MSGHDPLRMIRAPSLEFESQAFGQMRRPLALVRLRRRDPAGRGGPKGTVSKRRGPALYVVRHPRVTTFFRCALSRLGEPSQSLAGTGLLCSLLSFLICFA
jgi:hypothetical protein